MDKTWTEILIDWFPMLLLIGAWIVMIVKGQAAMKSKDGKTQGEIWEEMLAESRRQNELLEQLLKDQEARLQRLEAKMMGNA